MQEVRQEEGSPGAVEAVRDLQQLFADAPAQATGHRHRKEGRMKTREWRALIRKLRERFPVQGQVTVRRYPTKKDCGLTTFDGSNYRVRVNSDQPDGGQVDTLLHEWAHVRAIEQAYRHEGPWGVLYAEIYDAWTKDFEKPEAPEPQGTE